MNFVGLDQLKERIPFCTVGEPSLKGDELVWDFNWEQFRAAQAAISGAEFGETIEESIAWFLRRGKYLAGQAELNEYSYHPVNGYCSYGWFEEADNVLYLWYETTRGTILTQRSDEMETKYQVLLPATRKGGMHNALLDVISYMAGGLSEAQAKAKQLFLYGDYQGLVEWLHQQPVKFPEKQLPVLNSGLRVSSMCFAVKEGDHWIVFTIGLLGDLTLNLHGCECQSTNWHNGTSSVQWIYKHQIAQQDADRLAKELVDFVALLPADVTVLG